MRKLSFPVAPFQQLFGVIDIAVHHAPAVPADYITQSLTCRQQTLISHNGSVSRLIAVHKHSTAAEGTPLVLNVM